MKEVETALKKLIEIGFDMLRFITQKFKSQTINEVMPIDSQIIEEQVGMCTDSTVDELLADNFDGQTTCSITIFKETNTKVDDSSSTDTFRSDNKENIRYETCKLCGEEPSLTNSESNYYAVPTLTNTTENNNHGVPPSTNSENNYHGIPHLSNTEINYHGVPSFTITDNNYYHGVSTNTENNCHGCLECFKTQLTTLSNAHKMTSTQPYTLEQLKDVSQGEKRKYSRIHSRSHVKFPYLSTHQSDSSSSDDEIKDLCSKYKCLSQSGSRYKCISQSSRTGGKTLNGAAIFKHNNHKIMCVDGFGVARPSLNFEKMQQKLLKRSRPRMVRIKTIQPLQSHELTELLAFKPINIMSVANCSNNRLVPVEEPLQTGYVF